MKTIKFRGKDENTGKYVYGDLCNISSVISTPSIINEHGNRIFVAPETVAQFVGYDKNGKEVYSDDAIYSFARGDYFKAENFFRICDIGETFLTVELVEKDSKNET